MTTTRTGGFRLPTPGRGIVWLALLAVLMTGLKLYCAATTLGTNDVKSFQLYANYLESFDLTTLYRKTLYFNHTPLMANYISLINAQTSSLQGFAFWLRLPGILADLAVALLLISQRRKLFMAACPDWALALFIASPVAFMVSGFHGNFDSVMIALLVFATWLAVAGQAEACALFFGLSMQVKVVPMIVLPVFFVFWLRRERVLRFCATVAVVCLVGWIEPLTRDPLVLIRNVIGYNSLWGFWGLTYWLKCTHLPAFALATLDRMSLAELVVVKASKAFIMVGITALAWSCRPFTAARLVPVLAIAWSLFFVLAPGGCVQYLVWLTPFVLLFNARWYVALTGASALYCFSFYQALCRTLPWYYGDFHNGDTMWWPPFMILAWISTGGGLYLWWRGAKKGTAYGPAAPGDLSNLRNGPPDPKAAPRPTPGGIAASPSPSRT